MREPNSEMKRVVVIGAGAIGCAAAWHLRQRGCAVTLLEAEDGPATQASAAAAGFVAHWSTHFILPWGATEWGMQDYGIRFYTDMAERLDDDIGYVPCGIAFVYLNEETWRFVQPLIADAGELGTSLEVLGSDRCAEVLPMLDIGRVAGIVYEADAIRVRAADAIPALARELERDGVDLRYSTRMTGLLESGGRVSGVRTEQGTVDADQVVIAAGAWTRPLVDAMEVPCPAEPTVEARYTTRPIGGVPADMPLLIFPDCHGFYIREERGGLLIGGSDAGDMPADRKVDALRPPLSTEIETRQTDRIREYIREIEDVMPVLAGAEIEQVNAGLPTFTDENRFIVDEIASHRGAFFVSGCNEGGVTHGPGLGKLVSELMLDGSSAWDQFRIVALTLLGSSGLISCGTFTHGFL